MKPNKTLWLPTALVLIPISLAYLYASWIGISIGLSMPWATHISAIISDRNSIEVIVSPLVLATIMLGGVLINIKVSINIKKINILFLTLFVLIVILIFINKVFGMWADISLTDVLSMWAAIMVIVAWLLQRHTTKAWLKKNS